MSESLNIDYKCWLEDWRSCHRHQCLAKQGCLDEHQSFRSTVERELNDILSANNIEPNIPLDEI